ncbi:MAG: complex I subunit 1/NuoH family protein, partial [Chthoniobacterales bacterium]
SIVQYQIEHGWMIAPFIGDWTNVGKWLLAVPMFISFVVFMIAMFAETNRLPFDLPEAETELVGGYHTEYGSMKFGLFFLGGWHLPLPSWHGGFHWALIDGSRGIIAGLFNIVVFFSKVIALLFIFIWVRWTLPRFRYDQLMRLGWLFFFEIALVNIFIAALILAYFPQ